MREINRRPDEPTDVTAPPKSDEARIEHAEVDRGGRSQVDEETLIRPVSGWLALDLRSVWKYRDLIALMVRRDFVAQYAQTILGPAWHIVQPVLTTIMFTLLFNKVARLPTDGLPPSVFYMSGVVAWSYFSTCIGRTSTTFSANAHVFGKVWFPRLVVPISTVLSSLIAFAMQAGVLMVMIAWMSAKGAPLELKSSVWVVPLLVLQMGLLGLGCGLILTSLTTRYRDLANLVTFGVQLWMYATPVVYPASRIPDDWKWLMLVNPMAPIVEGFRVAVFGVGTLSSREMLTSVVTTLSLLAVGIVLFHRVEKSFIDTV